MPAVAVCGTVFDHTDVVPAIIEKLPNISIELFILTHAFRYVAILLDMPLRDVEQIVYFNGYVVRDPGDHKELKYKQLLTEDEWLEIEDEIYAEESEIENEPVVGIGAEALKQLLEDLNLVDVAEQLRNEASAPKVRRKPPRSASWRGRNSNLERPPRRRPMSRRRVWGNRPCAWLNADAVHRGSSAASASSMRAKREAMFIALPPTKLQPKCAMSVKVNV